MYPNFSKNSPCNPTRLDIISKLEQPNGDFVLSIKKRKRKEEERERLLQTITLSAKENNHHLRTTYRGHEPHLTLILTFN